MTLQDEVPEVFLTSSGDVIFNAFSLLLTSTYYFFLYITYHKERNVRVLLFLEQTIRKPKTSESYL
jgi:hypothetical protein